MSRTITYHVNVDNSEFVFDRHSTAVFFGELIYIDDLDLRDAYSFSVVASNIYLDSVGPSMCDIIELMYNYLHDENHRYVKRTPSDMKEFLIKELFW